MTVDTPPTLTPPAELQAVAWQRGCLCLLDQRHLPHEERYYYARHPAEVATAIRDMVVRGAPAIGIAAAYGVVLAARHAWRESRGSWRTAIRPALDELAAARPTAVNLKWAIARMSAGFTVPDGDPEPALLERARTLHHEDIDANRRIGTAGAALFDAPVSILTHCNAGALATGGYGTALGIVRSLRARGLLRDVYICETRPWLQGARLSAWELAREDIKPTLIADSAAALLMARGAVQGVITGADRIAVNGDVANKIGTCALALAARHHNVRMLIAAPLSTIDPHTPDGAAIPIELRSQDELLHWHGKRLAPRGVTAYNPVFDVTPAALIDALVTECGTVHNPDHNSITTLLQQGTETEPV